MAKTTVVLEGGAGEVAEFEVKRVPGTALPSLLLHGNQVFKLDRVGPGHAFFKRTKVVSAADWCVLAGVVDVDEFDGALAEVAALEKTLAERALVLGPEGVAALEPRETVAQEVQRLRDEYDDATGGST